jgi:predicted RNase H-like nuclease (RuvC/YqgF family)
MNPKMLKAMKAKKKREVDPNAPPRPNLLTHEKTIKGMNATAQDQQVEIEFLKRKLHELERKLSRQTNYLDAIHQRISSKK